MNRPYQREITCERKRRYDSWSAAESAALGLIERVQADDLPRYKGGYHMAYRCDYCDGWHIGCVSFHLTQKAILDAGFTYSFPWRRGSPRGDGGPPASKRHLAHP